MCAYQYQAATNQQLSPQLLGTTGGYNRNALATAGGFEAQQQMLAALPKGAAQNAPKMAPGI